MESLWQAEQSPVAVGTLPAGPAGPGGPEGPAGPGGPTLPAGAVQLVANIITGSNAASVIDTPHSNLTFLLNIFR